MRELESNGYGDQSTTTGNMASPLKTATSGVAKTVTATRPIVLDGGIGWNLHLLQQQTLNASLQYHFPRERPYWISVSYGSTTNFNMGDVTTNAFVTSADKIGFDKLSIYYADAFWEFSQSVRMAIEFNHIMTHYLDGISAANDRYQMSVYMTF